MHAELFNRPGLGKNPEILEVAKNKNFSLGPGWGENLKLSIKVAGFETFKLTYPKYDFICTATEADYLNYTTPNLYSGLCIISES